MCNWFEQQDAYSTFYCCFEEYGVPFFHVSITFYFLVVQLHSDIIILCYEILSSHGSKY
jgi:hypothetical protein